MIAPYDVALAHLDADARRRWGERAIDALTERYGSLAGMTFEVHAGDAYSLAIAPGLAELAATLSRPLAGLTMGRQLGWYRTHNPASMAAAITEDPSPGPRRTRVSSSATTAFGSAPSGLSQFTMKLRSRGSALCRKRGQTSSAWPRRTKAIAARA